MLKNSTKAKIVISAFCALTACSARDNNASKLNHEWSDTIRPKPEAMSQDCRESLFPTRARDKARLDKASLYLTKLGHYLAKEVNESYESEGKAAPFSGKYAIENFCFQVVEVDEVRNASSRAESGNVYFDYKYLKTFKNDAQVADTLAHEIAHILMGHLVLNHEEITDLTSEFAPNFKRENYPSDKELREIGKTCYEAQSNNIEEWFFYDYSDKFKGHKAIETLKENEVGFSFNFANHDIENMEPYATIRECNITVDRQKALKELFDLGDEFISADNEDFDSWNKAKKAILDLSKREDVVQAIKKAQKLSDQFKEEFESKDYNEMYNWKEEQADEVGSELLYRAGFDINSYLQFVKNYLALHPEQKTACANIRNEGRKAERGSGTHPSMCYRLQNFEHEHMQAHKDKYIDEPNEGKTTVFVNSQGPEFDSL